MMAGADGYIPETVAKYAVSLNETAGSVPRARVVDVGRRGSVRLLVGLEICGVVVAEWEGFLSSWTTPTGRTRRSGGTEMIIEENQKSTLNLKTTERLQFGEA